MSNRGLVNDVAIVGVGGAGTNIAFCLEKLGYTTIHINSSTQDESAIKGAKNIRHLKGFNGCAGNRALAEKALAENMDIVDEISALEESIVYVIFSSAGGTGSGVSTALIDMLVEETDKTICSIVVLPDKDEDFDFHVNSYKCCQELLEIENMGSVMFLDNNSGNKQTINSICTTMLNTFLSNNSVSELGNVDEQEKRTILSTHGSMVLSGKQVQKRLLKCLQRTISLHQFRKMESVSISVSSILLKRLTRTILLRLLVFQGEHLKAMEVTKLLLLYLVYHSHLTILTVLRRLQSRNMMKESMLRKQLNLMS